MQQFDMSLTGGTGMKQLKIYYTKVADEYICSVAIAKPGEPEEHIGALTVHEDDWKALPGMFAHNTILISH